MKFIFTIISTVIIGINAGFEYQVFSPYNKASYKLGASPKPRLWDIDPSTNTLYYSATEDQYNDIYINGTLYENGAGLRYDELTPSNTSLFYNFDVSVDVEGTPNTYGYYSSDSNIKNLQGGNRLSYSTVIADRRFVRSMPLVQNGEFRGITAENGGTPWPVDQGFLNHNAIPHLTNLPANTFPTTLSKGANNGIVNDRGICATNSNNDIVCTGEQDVIDGWRLKNSTVKNLPEYFKTCATKNHLFALTSISPRGEIVWLSSVNELPSQFRAPNTFSNIFCTNNLFAAVSSSTLYIVDMDNLGPVREVNAIGFITNSNLNSILVTTSFFGGTDVTIIKSLDENEDYTFQKPVDFEDMYVIPTFYSFAIYNGTYFEAYNPYASPDRIVADNAINVYSCAEGVYLYLNGTGNSWHVFTHGPNKEYIQNFLDTRVLLDWVTNDGYGCMLVKMTDEHTGRDISIPDYGPQGENGYEYNQGHYADQKSDVILLAISSVTLALLTIGFTVYVFKA